MKARAGVSFDHLGTLGPKLDRDKGISRVSAHRRPEFRYVTSWRLFGYADCESVVWTLKFAEMATTLPPKTATPELTVDRYVATLYPRLAWDATVRLGDAITAGRLVERVLQRAWRERDRFAAPEALLRHASESADAAIAREEARRVSVTHFDPEDGVGTVPGDLSGLSLSSVTWRLRRGPLDTPSSGVPVQPTPRASTAVAAPQMPRPVPPEPMALEPMTPTPIVPAPVSAAPVSAAPDATAPASAPPTRASWATPHAPASNGTPPATPARASLSGTDHSRASGRLRSASYIAADKPAALRRPVMLAVPVVVAVLAGLVWRFSSSEPAEARAWQAASDTSAAFLATGRGERRDTTLTPALRALLGPQSRVSIPAELAHGVRGLDTRGDVAIVAAVDSASPLVLRAHGQRLESVGGTVVVSSSGDTLDIFAESGDVFHVGATVRTRIEAGAVARIHPDGSVTSPSSDDASRRFAWRSGRLRLGPTEVRALRSGLGAWFGLDVVSDVRDTISLDVPLDSVNAVLAALRARQLVPTLAGSKLTIAAAPVARAPGAGTRIKVPTIDIEMPSLRKLPGVP
jgi:hypothetical protein